MNQQLNHQEIQRKNPNKEIILIAEDLERPSNYGGLIRTAECFGVRELIFVSEQIKELTPKMKRVSRSAENLMNIKFYQNIIEVISIYQKDDYEIVALELTSNSIPLQDFKTEKEKIILICGNEKNGISAEVLQKAHHTIKIPVYGTTSSLNVVVATGIALNQLNLL